MRTVFSYEMLRDIFHCSIIPLIVKTEEKGEINVAGVK
jgi:uncharacterized membrane protein YbjE (DUF340 family)